jgi:flagellar motor switch protein FliM
MKPLSVESIRSSRDLVPQELSAVTFGLKMAAQSISRETSTWTSVPLLISLESLSIPRPSGEMAADADGSNFSRLLKDTETGMWLRVTLSQEFSQTFCEAVLGGDVTEGGDQENRPLSPIEKDIGQIFIKLAVRKVTEALEFPKSTNFTFWVRDENQDEAEEESLRPQIVVTLSASLGNRKVNFSLDLPAEFILRVIENDPKTAATKIEPSATWTEKINKVLIPTKIELVVVLTELQMKLNTISNLRIGQTIPLPVNYKSSLKVRTGEVDLCNAHLGQSNGNYCLIVEEQTS